ncbi:hypothetical protein MAPG_04149 [Magnaporthiopsis poae ATCC 64411]|uniref:Uncharacterized protein n=1 Tax=Magnaporthiopsis poae (strain ATCC 64411 / 73-15) TaxID=644358 RepID=A0A0C4DVY2_MAGP6|nr:hypothetical protein MAPG_04149 [Magnaporthiopsis poae ATCC 64411]
MGNFVSVVQICKPLLPADEALISGQVYHASSRSRQLFPAGAAFRSVASRIHVVSNDIDSLPVLKGKSDVTHDRNLPPLWNPLSSTNSVHDSPQAEVFLCESRQLRVTSPFARYRWLATSPSRLTAQFRMCLDLQHEPRCIHKCPSTNISGYNRRLFATVHATAPSCDATRAISARLSVPCSYVGADFDEAAKDTGREFREPT